MDHIPEHYSIPVSMETQIYFPLQLWTAGLWSRMTLQHSDGPRHTSQHYCCLLTSTLLMSKDPFFTLFSHVYFLKFPILPEFRLTFLPHFAIILPYLVFLQVLPKSIFLSVFFISSRLDTAAKAVISSVFSQTTLASMNYFGMSGFVLKVLPSLSILDWPNFVCLVELLNKYFSFSPA